LDRSLSIEGGGVTAQESRPGKSRLGVLNYFIACFFFALVLMIGAVVNESNNACHIPFQIMLFLICSSPFFLGGNKPRHRLLVIFMACYYLIFGMSNFFGIILGANDQFIMGTNRFLKAPDAGMPKSDWVVIIGAVSFLCGYYLLSKLYGNRQSRIFGKDWNYGMLFGMGLVFWILGFMVSVAYDMVVTPMNIPSEILGMPLGIASNVKLLTQLGGMMIIYLAVRGYRPGAVWPLLVLMIIAEFCVGFIANSKETSYRLPALLTLGIYYIRGSINKKIIVIILLSFIPYLLFFNIWRGSIMTYQNQVQAFNAFDKNAASVLKEASKQKNIAATSLEGLKQRIDGKVYIDIIVNGTDSGRVSFQSGKTLMFLFYGLIPRMLWSGKPDLTTGQMFSRAFQLSASRFTYVPSTILGEFYWNFGTTGVIAGMICFGMVFGLLAYMLASGEGMTIVRFMLLLLATYFLAVRFESSIGLQYTNFIRLAFVLAILDALVGFLGLRRRVEQTIVAA